MALVNELKEKVNSLNPEKKEGPVARAIEEQTAKIPSDVFLWTAIGAIGASLVLKIARKDHLALFVGQWAPTFLLFGVYNKIVKTHGHDKQELSHPDKNSYQAEGTAVS
jgi:hypothetical protein